MYLAIREAECSQRRRGGCLCPCGVGAAVLSYSVSVLLWKEGEVKQNNPITAECLITSGARRKGEKRCTHPWRQLDARYLFIVVFSSATLIWWRWTGLALRGGGGTKMKLQAPRETLQCREMQLLWGERPHTARKLLIANISRPWACRSLLLLHASARDSSELWRLPGFWHTQLIRRIKVPLSCPGRVKDLTASHLPLRLSQAIKC